MQGTNPEMNDESLARHVSSMREPCRRKWNCPSNYAIASYLDGTLGVKQKSRLELHLSKCAHCRQILADIVKAERETELIVTPITLVNKAAESVPSRAVSRGWLLIPAGVVAIIVAIAGAGTFLRHPVRTALPPPAAVSPSIVAKTTAAPNAKSGISDVVRTLPIVKSPLRIILPRPGSVLKNEPMQIKWLGMPDAGFYEVRVLASDGDLVWKGETRESVLTMPIGVRLKDGSYFVSVTSYLPNGRTVKAEPTSFVMKR